MHRLASLALVVSVGFTASACSSAKKDAATSTTTANPSGATTTAKGAANAAADVTATLNASGSTFTKPYLDEAIAAFPDVAGGVTINYGGGGSGKGRQDLADQVTDFAGSDGLIKADDKAKFKGGEVLYFPTVAAPITLSFNVKGVTSLKLDGDTVAKIFQRTVKTWDDPAIKALNPGATLPPTAITPAHRSDSSGTTENFTKFLVSASPTEWKLGAGSTVTWPADEQAGNGNAGVAQIVKQTDGAIGYVDFSDAKANKFSTAAIKNKTGAFVDPSLEGTSAALDKTTLGADLSYNPLNADGDKAYPIATPTWILVYAKQTDKNKGLAIKGFLQFLYSSDAQQIPGVVDYATLPANYVAAAVAQIDKIQIPA